jgi:transcriptional regulator with XRE-family HTH domain
LRYPEELKDLATNIRKAREEAKLTRRELADFAGVSITFIRNLESGKTSPSAVALARIAHVLARATDTLLDHVRSESERVKAEFDQAVKNKLFEKYGVAFAGETKLDFYSKRSLLELLGHARKKR